MNTVIIAPAPGKEMELGKALEPWLIREPLAMGVKVFGNELTIELDDLWCMDKGSPNYGNAVDDRQRVVALMREMIPAELVAGCTVGGKDWTE